MNFVILFGLFGLIQTSQFCTNGNVICFSTKLSADENSMQFNVSCKSKGWCAFGLGSSTMAGAEIYMMYTSNGVQTISTRQGLQHSLPESFATQDFTVDKPLVASANQYVFTRSVLATSSLKAIPNGLGSIIYAYSDIPVINGQIVPHSVYGTSKVNLFSQEKIVSSPVTEDVINTQVLVHGVLMILAWLVLSFIGIFSARFLKGILGVWWFRVHSLSFLLVVLATIVGFSIIVASMQPGPHFKDSHHLIVAGLVVFVLMFLQIILGVYIDKKFEPNRTKTPIHDQIHWWNGRALYILAVINIYLGIQLAGQFSGFSTQLWIGSFIALIILNVVLFFCGQKYFGQVHHKQSTYEFDDPRSSENLAVAHVVAVP